MLNRQINNCCFCHLDLVIDDGIRIPYEDPDRFSDPYQSIKEAPMSETPRRSRRS